MKPDLTIDFPKQFLDSLAHLSSLADGLVWWDGFRTGLCAGVLLCLVLWNIRR